MEEYLNFVCGSEPKSDVNSTDENCVIKKSKQERKHIKTQNIRISLNRRRTSNIGFCSCLNLSTSIYCF